MAWMRDAHGGNAIGDWRGGQPVADRCADDAAQRRIDARRANSWRLTRYQYHDSVAEGIGAYDRIDRPSVCFIYIASMKVDDAIGIDLSRANLFVP